MPTQSIFALPDIHTDPAAREKAKDMLMDGRINVFYIEWAKPIDPQNLDKSFEGLNAGDASPTLKELTRLALDKGIPVVPVDIPPERVLAKLDEQSPDYAPHGQMSLFQDWGKAVRDTETAKLIGEDIKTRGPEAFALVLYGADHFKPKVDGDEVLAAPLDALIRKESGADVYKLNPAFGQVQAAAAPDAAGAAEQKEQTPVRRF